MSNTTPSGMDISAIKEYPLNTQFVLQHREEFISFLNENPPKFKKRSWGIGNTKLAVCFKDDLTCTESENDLRNKGLPTGLRGNTFVYLEMKDPKKHLSTHARVESYKFYNTYRTIQQKKNVQQFQRAGNLNMIDIIALNYYKYFGNPEEFLSSFRCISPEDSPTLVYKSVSSNEENIRSVALEKLISIPREIKSIDEPFSYSYDPKDIEQGSTFPGSSVSIRYRQFEKDEILNPKPWKITISNYSLVKKGRFVAKENIKELHLDLSDSEYREICNFVEQETTRQLLYQIDRQLCGLE